MAYSVRFSRQATKFLRKLPAQHHARLKRKFEDLAKDPFRYLDQFEGDCHKLRIGDWRAFVDVDQKENVVIIRVLDRRSRIYK